MDQARVKDLLNELRSEVDAHELSASASEAHAARAERVASIVASTVVNSQVGNWHAEVRLPTDRGPLRIAPSTNSRWSLAHGELVTDFHGLNFTMNAWELGVPYDPPIRVGGLLAIVYYRGGISNGVISWEIMDFPPGRDWWDIPSKQAEQPSHALFVIADRSGAHRDNDGVCRVNVTTR